MADIIVSGEWWRLEDDGALYIYCVGDMPLQYEFPPWNHYNDAVQSVVIQNSVTDIGSGAFAICEHLTNVTIPSSVTSIKGSAFENCLSLPSVTIPNSVTSIGNSAFSGCASLTAIIIPGGVTSIDDSAFENSGLVNVTIGSGVASIGSKAFKNCDDLSDVYYGGTETQWNAIEIGNNNEPLLNATIHYSAPGPEPVPEPATLSSIAVTASPIKTAYTVGDIFSPAGMVVTATYSDGTTATVTGYDYKETPLTVSDTSIGIGYFENGVYAETAVAITVTEPTPEPQPEPTAGRIRIQVTKNNGDTLTFDGHAAKQVEYVQSTSFDGNDVQVDEMTAIIRQAAPDWRLNWRGVNMKSPVLLTHNSRTEKYYHKGLRRVEKYDFKLTAQSPLGRLTDDFPGDIYSGTPLSNVIADVIGNSIPRNEYLINPLLSKVRVHGWIPYQERRATLHQLALAYGFIVRRGANNNLHFTVPDTGDPYEIPNSAIFTGGSVDYSLGRTYVRADITAYEYLPRETEAETLFDNSGGAPADKLIVRFDLPMFHLYTENLTIGASGVNYAEVSGYGRLAGKPYTKIESVFSVEGDPEADPQHILSVSDVPMITSLNAVSVGERLLGYHNAPAVVNMDILRTTQRSGDYVSFTDPFGDPQTGYITALSGSITSIDRASVSVVCGYVPVLGSDYDAVLVLTKDTPNPWIVPNYLNEKRIRVVLIGGGTGGASGQHGTDSDGSGGRGGSPGAGGKIWDSEKALEEKIIVQAGEQFIYECGTGGSGGHSNPVASDNSYVNTPGEPGTASTFGDHSSDEGFSSSTGFYDAIDGILYAVPGAYNGVDGGAATTGTERSQADDKARTQQRVDPEWLEVVRHSISLPWDTSQSWISGEPGAGDRDYERYEGEVSGELFEWAYGGLGGGAAVGCNGNNGLRAPSSYQGGNGSDGATAAALFPDIRYGGGGNGGHGGGAGGAGGKGHSDATGAGQPASTSNGGSGSGGAGSAGQNGADGCILIYYNSPDTYQ